MGGVKPESMATDETYSYLQLTMYILVWSTILQRKVGKFDYLVPLCYYINIICVKTVLKID